MFTRDTVKGSRLSISSHRLNLAQTTNFSLTSSLVALLARVNKQDFFPATFPRQVLFVLFAIRCPVFRLADRGMTSF